MKNRIFCLIALISLNLSACATFFELDTENDLASADRAYTEQDESEEDACYGRFCGESANEESDTEAAASRGLASKTSPDRKMQRAIAARDVVIGMTRQQVANSWGEPYMREVAGDKNGGHERWTYGSRYSLSGSKTVIFENGRVAGWNR
jgi:hypothetical protein